MAKYDGLIIPRVYNDYISKTDSATLIQALQNAGIIFGGDIWVAFHNIPRIVPKDITEYYNDGTLYKRLHGTDGFRKFEDIFVGDHFRMSRPISAYERTGQYQTTGSDYVTIAGISTLKGNDGDVEETDHLVMVAGKGFEGTQHFGRARMNPTHTTEGGYYESEMNRLTIGPVTNTGNTGPTATINEQLYAEFGEHLLTTNEPITDGIDENGYNRFGDTSGCASGNTWEDVQAVLMSEIECYGSIVWSSSGYDTGVANHQLPLFFFANQARNNRTAYYWLRDIASSALFCFASSIGLSCYDGASFAYRCVRPRFVIG